MARTSSLSRLPSHQARPSRRLRRINSLDSTASPGLGLQGLGSGPGMFGQTRAPEYLRGLTAYGAIFAAISGFFLFPGILIAALGHMDIGIFLLGIGGIFFVLALAFCLISRNRQKNKAKPKSSTNRSGGSRRPENASENGIHGIVNNAYQPNRNTTFQAQADGSDVNTTVAADGHQREPRAAGGEKSAEILEALNAAGPLGTGFIFSFFGSQAVAPVLPPYSPGDYPAPRPEGGMPGAGEEEVVVPVVDGPAQQVDVTGDTELKTPTPQDGKPAWDCNQYRGGMVPHPGSDLPPPPGRAPEPLPSQPNTHNPPSPPPPYEPPAPPEAPAPLEVSLPTEGTQEAVPTIGTTTLMHEYEDSCA